MMTTFIMKRLLTKRQAEISKEKQETINEILNSKIRTFEDAIIFLNKHLYATDSGQYPMG